MPDRTAAEPAELRSLRRRNLGRSLTLVVPFLVVWWLLASLVEHRFGLHREFAAFGTLAVLLLSASPVFRLLDRQHEPDMRRLRTLPTPRLDRVRSVMRIVTIVATLPLLAIELLTAAGINTPSPPDTGVGIVMIVLALSVSTVAWRAPDPDAPDPMPLLLATRRAHAVAVLGCVAALLLADQFALPLAPAIAATLLAACLTQQLSLALSRSAPPPSG
ncbi:MAG: hypothetical protein INR65_16200 [Gluconacetobacter diazotrophicus]|nr:hypothetical protein [Gluconacetobacter diazotrophicus]